MHCAFSSLQKEAGVLTVRIKSQQEYITNDEIAVIACARISNLDEDEANKFAKFVFIATCDKIYYYKTKTSSTLRVYYIAFLRTPFFAVREHF